MRMIERIMEDACQLNSIPTLPERATVRRPETGDFSPMNLAELDAEGLLARHDTKFLFPETHLPCLLAKLKPLCRILDIAGRRSFGYDSLYLDTPDRALFRAHHQGKVKRSKARWRVYRDTGACFFEVKYKASPEVTVKTRRESPDGPIATLDPFQRAMLGCLSALPLQPVLWVRYDRITLMALDHSAKFTIDTGLEFLGQGSSVSLAGLIVAEAKTHGPRLRGEIAAVLSALRARPERFSKYCAGAIALGEHRSQFLRPAWRHAERISLHARAG
jgi:hypothetical protein